MLHKDNYNIIKTHEDYWTTKKITQRLKKAQLQSSSELIFTIQIYLIRYKMF